MWFHVIFVVVIWSRAKVTAPAKYPGSGSETLFLGEACNLDYSLNLQTSTALTLHHHRQLFHIYVVLIMK